MRESMTSDQLNKARNPLLPAAVIAIQRAALQARQVASQTQTAVVISRDGKIERITPAKIQEPPQVYNDAAGASGDKDGA